MQDFTQAQHTLVLSDIHLADAELPDPRSPLWKRFKLRTHFIDDGFKVFLESMSAQIQDPIELVLNGDIFDFDSVMKLPVESSFHISLLEKLRGLSSEESKSRFKLKAILDDHPVWLEALRQFIVRGNRVIFIIGNHDMELHWPSTRQDIIDRLDLTADQKERVRFCEWFYVSNQDTLIEHGNQYDAYCLCSNPIHPLIKMGSKIKVRLPFGNLAGKYMVNGMGLMNPHATGSYIKESAWEYLGFYYKYVMRVQPFLLWTWFWSAMVTLICSITEGFLPALSDPLTVESRIDDIAKRANVSERVVIALKVVHVHPAIFNPFKILRELWLDRAILLGLIFFGSFQFFSFLNIFSHVSLWWLIVPVVLLLPAFIFYASSVQSEVEETQNAAFHMAPISARIAKVKRVIQGHTHLEGHSQIDDIEFINTGTWSPAYHDVECTQPHGRKCFAWIKPKAYSSERVAELYEWKGSYSEMIQRLDTVTSIAKESVQLGVKQAEVKKVESVQ